MSASLGASAFLLCDYPDRHTSKLRVVFTAYFYAAVVGFLTMHYFYGTYAIIITVFLTSFLMLISDVSHAPAVGASLGFVLSGSGLSHAIYLLASILGLLFVAKFLIYVYRDEFLLHKFHHEFLKINNKEKRNKNG